MHAMAVGDHFAVLIRAVAADFKKGSHPRRSPTLLCASTESALRSRSKATWPPMTVILRHPLPDLPVGPRRSTGTGQPPPRRFPSGRGLNPTDEPHAHRTRACTTDDIELDDLIRSTTACRTFVIIRSEDDLPRDGRHLQLRACPPR